MDEITIRGATLADAPRILEIYAYYVERTAISFEYEVPALAMFEERMHNVMRRYPYLVAESAGRVLGYAYAGPFVGRAAYDWACETTIYVDHEQRRRGLGRRLYEELERRLGEMGICNLCACIGYPTEPDEFLDTNSAEFHGHMGYAKVAHFHKCGCKFGRWYDMIWMEKLIGEHPENPLPVRFAIR